MTDLGGNIPLETCLKKVAAAGNEGIELGRKFPRDAAINGSGVGGLIDRAGRQQLVVPSSNTRMICGALV